MAIKWDDTAISNQALADIEFQSTDDWNWDHQHCPKCGQWVKWTEVEDDNSCPRCQGKEVEED